MRDRLLPTQSTPTATGDGGLLALESQLCFALYSTSRAMTAAYRPFLDAMGVTYPQYLVLLALWERPGMSLKELGERLQLDYGTLSPLTKRLSAAGLVEKVRSDTDERTVLLTATEASGELRAAAATMIETVLDASGYHLDEIGRLRESILEIRGRLETVVRARASTHAGT